MMGRWENLDMSIAITNWLQVWVFTQNMLKIGTVCFPLKGREYTDTSSTCAVLISPAGYIQAGLHSVVECLSCLCKVISTVSNGTNNSRSCNLSGQYRGRFCALSHKKLDCTVSAAEPRHVVAETQNLYPLLSTRTSFVNCFQLCWSDCLSL